MSAECQLTLATSFLQQVDLRGENCVQFFAPSPFPVITFGPFTSPTDVLTSLSRATGTSKNHFCFSASYLVLVSFPCTHVYSILMNSFLFFHLASFFAFSTLVKQCFCNNDSVLNAILLYLVHNFQTLTFGNQPMCSQSVQHLGIPEGAKIFQSRFMHNKKH